MEDSAVVKKTARKKATKRASTRAGGKSTSTQSAKKKKSVVTKSGTIKKTGVIKKVSKKERVQTKKVTDLPDARHVKVSSLTPSKERVQLALLTPFRFPLEYDKIAAQTARYAGIFFVLVGTLLSLMQVQVFNQGVYTMLGVAPQQALTGSTNCIDSALCKETEGVVSVSGDSTESTVTYTTDPKPSVQLKIVSHDGATHDTVSGKSTVTIVVERAEGVSLIVKGQQVTTAERISATKKADGTWHAVWDTTKYENGAYELHALVKNAYGTYESGFLETRVDNATLTDTQDNDIGKDGEVIETEQGATHQEDSSDAVSHTIDAAEEKQEVDDSKSTDDDMAVVTSENPSDKPELSKDSVLETERDTVLQPEIRVDIKGTSPLTGIIDIRIEAKETHFVELYVVPRYGLAERFVGLAEKIDEGKWLLRYDTRNTPNGEYFMYARVKNPYGLYASERQLIAVYNQIVSPESVDSIRTEKTETLDPITEVVTAVYKTNDTSDEQGELRIFNDNEEGNKEKTISEGFDSGSSTATTTESRVEIEDTVSRAIKDLYDQQRVLLEEEFKRLASAYRANDVEAVAVIQERIRDIQSSLIEVSGESPDAAFRKKLEERIAQDFERFEKNIETTERILKDRVGEEIARDSDRDGITDYDEVHLYNTDPFAADSDGDSFTDGAEILGGYDPKNDAPEAFVVYESPRDVGVVRDDLLEVSSIETIRDDASEVEEVAPKAVIKGRGLPNSFVTLYIFSTPIVVTVKTDADGSWTYRFDKELEDGTHEVYVGITDNTGRIVAKSNPLSFVKTAEAFAASSGVEDETLLQQNDVGASTSLLGTNMMLITASLIVVCIGLILILLGLHTETRRVTVVAQ